MPTYTVKPQNAAKKTRGQLAMALRQIQIPNVQDSGDDGFRCEINGVALEKKFVRFMAEFNKAMSPVTVWISHGVGIGEQIDLNAIDISDTATAAPPQAAPSAGVAAVFASNVPTTGHPAHTGTHAPDASADHPHLDMAILQQVAAARAPDATVSMLAWSPTPLPFRLGLDVRPIQLAAKKIDPRSPEPQRAHIKIGPIGERGYRISRDKGMPADRRWVLNAVDAQGGLIRIAEGSQPLAVGLCIIAYETGDASDWIDIVRGYYRGGITAHTTPGTT